MDGELRTAAAAATSCRKDATDGRVCSEGAADPTGETSVLRLALSRNER